MPQEPTAKSLSQLSLRLNRLPLPVIDILERFVMGEKDVRPTREWALVWDDVLMEDVRGYSNEEIKSVIDSERVFRATTLDDWLEIARDFYQGATGTKRRPKLLEDEFVAYLRLDVKYGTGRNGYSDFEPEGFLNAVWMLGKDATVDHENFETLPYYVEEGGACWRDYSGKAFDHFRKYRPPEFDGEQVTVEPEPPPTEPHPNCQARCHMGQFEFAIHDYAMGLSRKNNGECWLSRDTTAKWTGMHAQTAKAKIDWLVEHGWLAVIKAPKAGRGGQGTYLVLSHADWTAKFGTSGCLRKPIEMVKS